MSVRLVIRLLMVGTLSVTLVGCVASSTVTPGPMTTPARTLGPTPTIAPYLVADDAVVLAGDAYDPPFITDQAWWASPDRDLVRQVIDPSFAVSAAAPAHGFTFVDTELAFNGPELEPAPPELFQADGLHPTAAGARLAAETFAAADGLGD